MTAGTPIPAGVLTVDDEPNAWGRFYILDASGWCVGEVTDKQRARLLAGPARPDGVPDDAVPLTIWFTPDDRDGMTRGYAPDGGEIALGFSLGETWRFRGVPVPPYQPAPDPSERPETVREHFNGHCCADDPECEHSFLDTDDLARHMASEYQPDPEQLLIDKIAATYPPTDPADSPTHKCVAHPDDGHCERTGPLDPYALMAAERVRAHAKHADDSMEDKAWDHPAWLSVLVEEVGEVAEAMCDFRHQGKTTDPEKLRQALLSELVQVGAMAAAWIDSLSRGRIEAASRPDRSSLPPREAMLDVWMALGLPSTEFDAWVDDDVRGERAEAWAFLIAAIRRDLGIMADSHNPPPGRLLDMLAAASRPDPDSITVNRDDLRRVLDWIGRMDGQDAGPYMSVLRLSRALAAAGLPQEPTEGGEQ